VVSTDGGSFEQGVCAKLALSGCAIARSSGCVMALSSNRIAGGYLTQWAACIYSGTDPTLCHVPCGDAGK